MNLFKYTTENIAIKILRNQKIRFTQPIAFNDPFDAHPYVSKLYSEEEQNILLDKFFEQKELIKSIVYESFEKTLEENNIPPIGDEKKKKLLQSFFSMIEEKHGSLKEFFLQSSDKNQLNEETINNFIANIFTLTGVLSLTKDSRNLLMWSHYANYHRGVVFEFDGNNSFFVQSDSHLYPKMIETKYTMLRPRIEFTYNDFNDTNRLFKMFSDIYFTKSLEWQYESEYRVVRRLSEKTNSDVKDVNGFDIHLFDFPKNILKGIIFGCKCSKKTETEIEDIISQRGYQKINFKKVFLDKEKYLLRIKEI